jgi:hypothetical protein
MLTIIGFSPELRLKFKAFHHGVTEAQRKSLIIPVLSLLSSPFLCASVVKALPRPKAKAAIWNRGPAETLLKSSRSWLTRSPRKFRRSRYSGKPVAKLPGKRSKSRHDTKLPACNSELPTPASRCGYCIELATLENALFAFDPISRIVPTTRTSITASITAYSAISCPSSSDQILRINSDMRSLQSVTYSLVRGKNRN